MTVKVISAEKLDVLPLMAAESVREYLHSASLAEYQHFLDHMYHYTRRSEENLLNAACHSHTEELKDYFEHMAKEERGHYLLAERDLEGFGLKPSNVIPSTVQMINRFWDEQKSYKHGNAFLGIVYVFENVAQHVGEDIKALLQRLEVTKKQSRWLSVHAEADLEHGDEAEALTMKYMPENPELLVTSAEKACELWIKLMQAAFTLSPEQALAS